MYENGTPRFEDEETAWDDYERTVAAIEEEILACISAHSTDVNLQQANAAHIANIAERILNFPIPDTSEDRIFWHIRKEIARKLSGGIEFGAISYPDKRIIGIGTTETEYVMAIQANGGRPLAIKIARDDLRIPVRENMRNEQSVLARLWFMYKDQYPPNLLKLFAVGDGVTATERVMGGRNLEREVTSFQGIETIRHWMQDICQGLESLYKAGYCRHGDVSLDNCILGDDGIVRVGDFSQTTANARYLKQAEFVQGNATYMAPETRLRYTYGLESKYPIIDRRADVYSLGVMLHEFLTLGNDPFSRQKLTAEETDSLGGDAYFLAAYAQTIKKSDYRIKMISLDRREFTSEEIDFFAAKYSRSSVDYPDQKYIQDKNKLQRLDRLISDCLSFDLDVRPSSPAVFYDRLVSILAS